MAQEYYRQTPQPQYGGPYGPPDSEEFPYPYQKPGLGSMAIASIVLGVFCLGLFILLVVVWSGRSPTRSRLRQEMATNIELRDDIALLKRRNGDLTRKIAYHKQQALAKQKETPLTGEGAPETGTPAYWKARYEQAKRQSEGWEKATNRYKAILEQAGSLKRGGTSPPPPKTSPGPGAGT